MDLKLTKLMAIVVLSVLAFTCFAEDEQEPNKPAISKAGLSAESSQESTTQIVTEEDSSADLIEAKLAKEYYKDCVQNLKWALGIIIALVVGFVGYALFKNTREYRQALTDVKDALSQAREACSEARQASDKARDYEEKAHERLRGIDKEVASKLKEIEEKGKALVTELIQESEKQRETSREEAEKERKASELWNMGLRAVNANDFESAANYFAEVVEIRLKDHAAYSNWGAALTELSKTREGPKAEEILAEALEKCKKAIEIKPDYSPAYNSWGSALLSLARRKEDAEADELFKQAINKYEKALQIKPNLYEAYNNLGNVFCELGNRKEGPEADELFKQAFEQYEKAVEIKPDKHQAYNNWGTMISKLAQKKKGENKTRLIVEAKEKCLKAELIKTGVAAYNLACLSALLGDEIECRKWLETSDKAGTLGTREKAMNDPDLESMRDKEWFKQLCWEDDAK